MLWSSPTHGTLECGCEIDQLHRLTSRCPAHADGTPVQLQQFALDQSARIRGLEQDLASSRTATKKAQLYRHRLNLQARKDSKSESPDSLPNH